MKIRKAVAVLLTRNPGSPEVCLVKRNHKLRFFGGYFAFPGGTLEKDEAPGAIRNIEQVSTDALPYIFTAAREIFEETGVLLTRGPSPVLSERCRIYRKNLLAETVTFHEILAREGQHIDARDFRYIDTLLTPEFAPVRYDTQFYLVKLPEGQQPEIIPGELVDGGFYQPEQAIAAWKHGEMPIVPPVIFMLQHLAGRDVDTGLTKIKLETQRYRQGAIHDIPVSPGVLMLPLLSTPLPPATHTNAYLVGERECYLVDPAPAEPDEQQRLFDFLDLRLAEGRHLRAILLTHHHPDHIGAVAACRERYRLPVFGHHITAELLGETFDKYLAEGDALALGTAPDASSDWHLQVHQTPGHAPDHLVFQESRYGSVIVGDMISALSTVVIDPKEGHIATYLRSLQKLEKVTDGILCPGHGPTIMNGKKAIRRVLQHRQERESKLVAALSNEPQTTAELVPIVYADVDRSLWRLAALSLEAGLIKLVEEGKCRHRDGGYVVVD